MKCKKAQSLMLDHLYDDLKPRQQNALIHHLQACPKCSEQFEAQKATTSTFGKLIVEEPPRELTRRVAAMAAREIERHGAARERLPWYWRPALATAALFGLAVVLSRRFEVETWLGLVAGAIATVLVVGPVAYGAGLNAGQRRALVRRTVRVAEAILPAKPYLLPANTAKREQTVTLSRYRRNERHS